MYILRFNDGMQDICKRAKLIFLFGKPSAIVRIPARNSTPKIPNWKVYSRVNFPDPYLYNILFKSICKTFHLI